MIVPSLLSYTLAELEQKCLKIRTNQDRFRALTHQTHDSVCVHMDIIMPQFASLRSIKKSTQYLESLTIIQSVFAIEKLIIQIHIMGETRETKKLLESIEIIPGFTYFVHSKSSSQLHLWYDVHEWTDRYVADNSLLMLVSAGRGGQKKVKILFEEAVKITNYATDITLDGGLTLADNSPKAFIVVGSDFWQKF